MMKKVVLFTVIMVFILSMFSSCTPEKKLDISDDALEIAMNTIATTDDFLDRNLSAAEACDKAETYYFYLESEYEKNKEEEVYQKYIQKGYTYSPDWLEIQIEIQNIQFTLSLYKYDGFGENKVLEARNKLAETLGIKKRK